MVQEEQEEVFKSTFQPSCVPLIVMMMTGLPLDMSKVQDARTQLYETEDKAKEVFYSSPYVKRAEAILHDNLADKYNKSHKTKQKTAEDFKDDRLNPGSSQQLQLLLFDVLKFDVLETTDTGAPSVGGAVIKNYITQSEANGDTDAVDVLNAVLDIAAATKVNGTFLSAFETLSHKHSPSGLSFLNGNLKLGGTQSGRLSSSEPNLQNLPSNSIYGKLVKSCFVAPKGWLFCGADFSALEYKIGALLSKDKM
jgi:DNA polymerase-1